MRRRERPAPKRAAGLIAAWGGIAALVMATLLARPAGPSVPVSGEGLGERTLALSPSFLRWALGSGLPTLGVVSPQPFVGVTGASVAAWVVGGLTSVVPGDALSVIGATLPGVAVGEVGKAASGHWPSAQSLAPQPTANTGGVLVLGGTPQVGIYQTNSRDSFTWAVTSRAVGPPVSNDPRKNVTAVGLALARALAADGVGVVHSSVVNDAGGVLGAYVNSARTASSLLRSYPTLRYLVDVDRGSTNVGVVQVGGRKAARVTLVVGSADRLPNPHWQENEALAQRLAAQMQFLYPGLLVAVEPSPDRLNQQLLPGGSLTIDVGGPASTLSEEEAAAALVAQALKDIMSTRSAPAGTG